MLVSIALKEHELELLKAKRKRKKGKTQYIIILLRSLPLSHKILILMLFWHTCRAPDSEEEKKAFE